MICYVYIRYYLVFIECLLSSRLVINVLAILSQSEKPYDTLWG